MYILHVYTSLCVPNKELNTVFLTYMYNDTQVVSWRLKISDKLDEVDSFSGCMGITHRDAVHFNNKPTKGFSSMHLFVEMRKKATGRHPQSKLMWSKCAAPLLWQVIYLAEKKNYSRVFTSSVAEYKLRIVTFDYNWLTFRRNDVTLELVSLHQCHNWAIFCFSRQNLPSTPQHFAGSGAVILFQANDSVNWMHKYTRLSTACNDF